MNADQNEEGRPPVQGSGSSQHHRANGSETYDNPYVRTDSRLASEPFCTEPLCLLLGCDLHVWCPLHGSVRPGKCCGQLFLEYPFKRAGQLTRRDFSWLADDHAWSTEQMIYRDARSVPYGVQLSWRDRTFKRATVHYLHPDERTAYAEDHGPCWDHRDKGLQPKCRSCYPKSKSGRGENGLAVCRPTKSGLWLLIEGIGQSGAVASCAPEPWGVLGMNGCRGVHGPTRNKVTGALQPTTDLAWARGATVLVGLDADRLTNPDVADAAEKLPKRLFAAGAKAVGYLDIPRGLIESPTDGLDDVLARQIWVSDRIELLERLIGGRGR